MRAASNLARAAAEEAEEGDEAEELEEVEEDAEDEEVLDSLAGVSLGGLVASGEEPGGVGGDPEVRNLACLGHAARRHSIGCWCFRIIGLWLAASTVRRSGRIVVNLVDVAAVLNTGGGAEVRLLSRNVVSEPGQPKPRQDPTGLFHRLHERKAESAPVRNGEPETLLWVFPVQMC